MPDLEDALAGRQPARGGAARHVMQAIAFHWAIPGRSGETWVAALPRTLESAAVALGVGGQLYDAWGTAPHDSWLNFHAAFGVALCAAVIAHFYPTRRHLAAGTAPFARYLSRRVYVLLYGLMGIKLLVNLSTMLRGSRGRAALLLFNSPEAFQIYLAYGLLALVIIRVLARAQEHRRTRRIECPPSREPRGPAGSSTRPIHPRDDIPAWTVQGHAPRRWPGGDRPR